MNESSKIKDLEDQAANTKYLVDRINRALYGMTWEERDRLFFSDSTKSTKKEKES